MRTVTFVFMVVALFCASSFAQDFNYEVGVGIADITGPAVGVQMWGFVKEGQVTEGIHLRLRARAFVMADDSNRIAFVSADLGSVTQAIQWEVVDRLRAKYGDLYTVENVIVSATHTHAGPGGYWHYGVSSPLGGAFHQAHFDAIVDGIVDAIGQAHDSLAPGRIRIAAGNLENAGAQRSRTAYEANPESERTHYGSDTDTVMTLLRFETADGPIGELNWFAVHPTAMTYNNKLISGDQKGYASYAFEKKMGNPWAAPGGFVAGFAQTNCGDVTANLNLDNTGPGENEFETTRIIGERQFEKALELFESAEDSLKGGIDYRHAYVDFSKLIISDEFTGAGEQCTCASAFGYSFAAGSTEDGGGHPLFHEGMLEQNKTTDTFVKQLYPMPEPDETFRACHAPKPILFPTGITDPPSQPQIQPLGLVTVGQLAIVVGPAEFTTMSGRRIRETVRNTLGDSVEHVVIAGYANNYAGYVTTKEEYDTQQYEGGHTLFGPWSLAGYRQEYNRLATALAAGKPVEKGPQPRDLRREVANTPLASGEDVLPRRQSFGDEVSKPPKKVKRGEIVEVAFWSGNPRNDYHAGGSFLTVERELGGEWTAIANDADWETKCRWVADENADGGLQFVVTWAVPEGIEPGTYRIVHEGKALVDGNLRGFRGVSREIGVE